MLTIGLCGDIYGELGTVATVGRVLLRPFGFRYDRITDLGGSGQGDDVGKNQQLQ